MHSKKSKIRSTTVFALLVLISINFFTGCGSGKNNIVEENAQHLVDIYADYLNSNDPILLDEIAEMCPSCVFEYEGSRYVDERILMECLKACKVDLSSIDEYYKNSFSSDQFPLEAGAITLYYAAPFVEEDVGKVFVSFTLEGPWDFSQLPDHPEDIASSLTDDASRDPNHEKFPEAYYAISTSSGGGSITEYVSKDEHAIYEYGMAGDLVNVLHFSKPDILLEFPIKVGKAWQNSYEASLGSAANMTVFIFSKVVAKGRIVLPAAAYENAYLLQRRCSNFINGTKLRDYIVYIWYVPYVGEVARIQSMDNETDEVFTQALTFHRLKYTTYSNPSE